MATDQVAPPSGYVLELMPPAPPPGFELVPNQANPYQEAPNLLERTGRGIADVTEGIKQLYLLATDKEAAAKYTKEKNADIALYEKGRGKDAGFDWARLGGNVLATAPSLLVPGATAATTIGRMGAGAVGGALTGAANFDPSGSWGGKALQTATGATVGAALPPVAGAVAKGAVSAWDAAVNATRPAISAVTGASSKQGLTEALTTALSRNGLDFANLNANLQARLIADAKEMLNATGKVDGEALLRKLDIEAVGGKPTQAMVSRDPKQWYWERETSKIRGAGDPLQDAFITNNQALLDRMPAIRNEIAKPVMGFPRATSAYEAAERAREAVQKYGQEAASAASATYKAAEKAPGAGDLFPGAEYMARIRPIIETFEDKIPAPVTRRLQELDAGLNGHMPVGGTPPREFTAGEATKLYQLINDAMGGEPGKVGHAGRLLNKELVDLGMADKNTGASMKLFKEATGQYREMKQTLEPTPIARLFDAKEAPVNFIETNVLGGKPGELYKLKSVVEKQNPEIWNDIRAQAVDWMTKKATNGDAAEGVFSGVRFAKAMEQIGKDRLNVLFNPAEYAQLQQVARASKAMTKEPGFAGVNYSNTGSTIANLIGKTSRIPFVGGALALPLGILKAGAEGVEKAAEGAKAQAAVTDVLKNLSGREAMRASQQETMANILRMYGAGTPFFTNPAIDQVDRLTGGAP